MPTNLEGLETALRTEFSSDVSFAASLPSTFTTPSVVVAPADPYLEVSSMGEVKESWDVLVCVSTKDNKSSIAQMRQLSLRVMRAVQSVGAIWRSAGGPRLTGGDDRTKVVSVNRVDFKYVPSTEIPTP
jgi:hypothetical protein